MHSKYRVLISLTILIIAAGTIFFRLVEGWSWLDSYFFTVVTITTVGYGNLVPITAIGKIGTTILILLGIGVVAVALNAFGSELIANRSARIDRNRDTNEASSDDQTGK